MATGGQDIEVDIYARVSRLGDDKQRSTGGQVEDCQARAKELGHRAGQIHIDNGRSAHNPRAKRPGWDTLMQRLENGQAGGVIVFDLARFSRRPIEGERLIEAAERGITVLDSEDEYDLLTATGRKHFRDQLSAAAYESDRLSTRVKRGKRIKAMRGETSSSTRPFGFELDATAIRESEAEIIREVATRILAGESLRGLVDDLESRGVTTSTGRNWSCESLKQMLLRPRNAGQIVHAGVIVSRLPGEPIVSAEQWDDLSTLFASRRRGRPASDVYLCSGLVVCGLCGHQLSGRPRRHVNPYPDGEVRRHYWCHPRASTRAGCGRLSIDWRYLNEHVRALTIAILSDPRHAAAIEAAGKAAGKKREQLETAIGKAEHLAEILADRLGREEITLSRFDAAVKPLDEKLSRLKAELGALKAMASSEVEVSSDAAAASTADWTRRWDAAATSEQRLLFQRAMQGRKLKVMPAQSRGPVFDSNRIIPE